MPQDETTAKFRRYAGTVLWPSDPATLADTTVCPACFTPLESAVCRKCSLDLSHRAAADLAALSRNVTDQLEQRVELIGRIRYETGAGRTRAFGAQTPTSFVAVRELQTPGPASASAAAPQSASTPIEPSASTPYAEPRRSSVQLIMLIVGISLLSVFAIFFLVYAFINFGIIWRSIIIAAITVAAFVGATILRRTHLPASAEGVAVFAVILIYLDAYAVRANDFFGTQGVASEAFWGATLVISSIGFISWHRHTGMRAASVVGWVALSPGVGMLVWGLTEGVHDSTRTFVALAATAVAGFGHLYVTRPTFRGLLERVLVLATTSVVLLVLFFVAFAVSPSFDWGGTIACAVLTLIAALHAVAATLPQSGEVHSPERRIRTFGYVFAVLAGVSAAMAGVVAATRIGGQELWFAVMVPAVAAVTVTLGWEALFTKRLRGTALGRSSLFALVGAGTVACATLLLPIGFGLLPSGVAVLRALGSVWSLGLTEKLTEPAAESVTAVVTLGIVLVLAGAAWLATDAIKRRAAALSLGAAATLVLAVPLLETVWLVLTGWLLLALAGLAVLLRSRTRDLARSRPAAALMLVASTVLLYLVGWASEWTWPFATAATIAVLLSARMLVRFASSQAALLGAAIIVTLIAAAAAAHQTIWHSSVGWQVDVTNSAAAVCLAAVVLLATAAIARAAAITRIDRRLTFWITLPTAFLSAMALRITLTSPPLADEVTFGAPASLLPQFLTSLVVSSLLLGAVLLWAARRTTIGLRPERILASIAVGAAIYWVVDSFARLLELPELVHTVVPATAGLLAAAGTLAVTLTRTPAEDAWQGPTTPRWAREAGVAVVTFPALLVALLSRGELGWLAVLIISVTVLLLAIDRDGLFTSNSPRRHLGWVALALASGALWWRLTIDHVEVLEPYVLPVAAVLLAVSALIWRAALKMDAGVPSKAAPLVAVAGLLIGVLPLAINSVGADLSHGIVMFAVSTALLLAGSLVVAPVGLRPYLDSAALAGAIGLLVTYTARGLSESSSTLVPDAWVGAGLLVLLMAAFGQARSRNDSSVRWRAKASQMVGIIGFAAVLLIEMLGFADHQFGLVRVIATVALFSAIHVIAMVVDAPPFTRAIAWVTIVFAAIAAMSGLITGTLEPVEFGTVPIALALLASGAAQLSSHPAARSWPWLGPGVASLLVPSLLATSTNPELWRLVALGVAAVLAILVGAALRLQALFVVGAVVALIHGFATFAPQIRAVYESQEWWLWAGLAGIILVALAVRYEKRIHNLTSVAMRIAALR